MYLYVEQPVVNKINDLVRYSFIHSLQNIITSYIFLANFSKVRNVKTVILLFQHLDCDTCVMYVLTRLYIFVIVIM